MVTNSKQSEICLKCGAEFERKGGKVYCNTCGDTKKRNAYTKVYRAIKAGRLKRGSCEECGNTRVQAHHDDYDEPLVVRWLCSKHHPKADKIRRWTVAD